MARPLLPPRGVFVPARLVYNPQLPAAALSTWVQLRGLAWGREVTPLLRMQELAALTGKCQATLYAHMSLLRSMSALSWRSTGQGTIIVSFAAKSSDLEHDHELPSPLPDSKNLDSQNQESEDQESEDQESSHPLNSSR